MKELYFTKAPSGTTADVLRYTDDTSFVTSSHIDRYNAATKEVCLFVGFLRLFYVAKALRGLSGDWTNGLR